MEHTNLFQEAKKSYLDLHSDKVNTKIAPQNIFFPTSKVYTKLVEVWMCRKCSVLHIVFCEILQSFVFILFWRSDLCESISPQRRL